MGSKGKKLEKLRNEDYHIYYGIPHCHTAASTGRGTIREAVDYAKSKTLDFIIFSDHSTYLCKTGHEHKTAFVNQKETIKKYRHNHKRFLPILAFEYKLFQNLDINIITERDIINGKLSVNQFIQWLKKNGSIGIINHPGEGINKIKNSLQLNEFITCIETGNGTFPNRYKRYYKSYFHLLDLGWKLAAVNGQDNHRRNWGDADNVTAIFAKKLNYPNLRSAFLSRHTYSTESKTLKVWFKINNCTMGDILRIKEKHPLTFNISAEDPNNEIEKIKIFTNGSIVFKETQILSNQADLIFTSEGPHNNNSWYVVNIIMKNNREAITSPIFIEFIE